MRMRAIISARGGGGIEKGGVFCALKEANSLEQRVEYGETRAGKPFCGGLRGKQLHAKNRGSHSRHGSL